MVPLGHSSFGKEKSGVRAGGCQGSWDPWSFPHPTLTSPGTSWCKDRSPYAHLCQPSPIQPGSALWASGTLESESSTQRRCLGSCGSGGAGPLCPESLGSPSAQAGGGGDATKKAAMCEQPRQCQAHDAPPRARPRPHLAMNYVWPSGLRAACVLGPLSSAGLSPPLAPRRAGSALCL